MKKSLKNIYNSIVKAPNTSAAGIVALVALFVPVPDEVKLNVITFSVFLIGILGGDFKNDN